VVEVRGEVVAFAVGDARDGNIWALFVAPGHEGHGYGRRLHDIMVDWLAAQGCANLAHDAAGHEGGAFLRVGGLAAPRTDALGRAALRATAAAQLR
jgi:GNAT superfamily N-acetyltransferase